MKKLGIIGYPLSHTKSPQLHDAFASFFDLTLTYMVYSIPENQLKKILEDVRNAKISGLNVTIPYKEKVIPLLDELIPQAKKIGAVNTIYLNDHKLIGDNTDYDGFKGLIEKSGRDLKDKRFLILGTGGAAKAVYHVLNDLGYKIQVVSRTKRLDKDFGEVIGYDDLNPKDYDVVVNTTPVGMYPNQDSSPLDQKFVKGKIVFDLIYNPLETKLMRFAEHAFNGINMLIIQGIKAESIWHQKEFKITDELLKHIKGAIL